MVLRFPRYLTCRIYFTPVKCEFTNYFILQNNRYTHRLYAYYFNWLPQSYIRHTMYSVYIQIMIICACVRSHDHKWVGRSVRDIYIITCIKNKKILCVYDLHYSVYHATKDRVSCRPSRPLSLGVLFNHFIHSHII